MNDGGQDDLTYVVNLSPDAMRALQALAKAFIQSCFNSEFAIFHMFRNTRVLKSSAMFSFHRIDPQRHPDGT